MGAHVGVGWRDDADVSVAGGAVAVVAGGGWQATRLANMIVINIQLNKDRLENMSSLPSK